MSTHKQEEAQQHRKNFAIGLAIIGGLISLASFSSTYSINLESFKDWGSTVATALAFGSAAGIEVMFCLVIYGIGYALVGFWEKALGVASLAYLLATMTTNFVIHRQIVKQITLSGWQQNYYDWIGAATLFGVLLIIVLFGAFSHEAKDRRLEREINTIANRKALNWKKDALNSDDFVQALEPHKQAVFAEVKKQLSLPPAGPTKTQPGFARSDSDPKS
jgi:hypothetical protein